MSKVFGEASDFAYIKNEGSRIVIGYGLQQEDGNDACTWQEVYLAKRQVGSLSLQKVKDAVIGDINARTDDKILRGMLWEGQPVWLSTENQKNFSEAQRAAAISPEILPLKLKVGEYDAGGPIYHTFATAEALTAFYLAIVAYVNQCLNDGWAEKDAIDWTPYERLFPEGEGTQQND